MGPDGMGCPPPMVGAFHDPHMGRWWNDPHMAQQLNLTAAQKTKMDAIFEQHKLNLIDLVAALEKQQVLLGPMISADSPNEAQVLAQIDKIAQARANLEKANARMLFDIRKTLTVEQWQKLKTLHRERRMEMRHGRRMWRDHGGSGSMQGPPPPPQDGQPTPQP
jgi:Spy/CpxP family protein refolding chaperone